MSVKPTKFPTAQEHEANLPKQETHDYSAHLPEDSEAGRMHKPAPEGAHFSDKIYLFPESYNALRRELVENWPKVWQKVGYLMAFDAVAFVEHLDAVCNLKTTFDSQKVDAICKRYLDALRNLRGLSSLH